MSVLNDVPERIVHEDANCRMKAIVDCLGDFKYEISESISVMFLEVESFVIGDCFSEVRIAAPGGLYLPLSVRNKGGYRKESRSLYRINVRLCCLLCDV